MGWATQRGPRPRLVATSHRLASCVIVSRFRTALDLDTYPLSNFIRPRCAERAKRVASRASRFFPRMLMRVRIHGKIRLARETTKRGRGKPVLSQTYIQKYILLVLPSYCYEGHSVFRVYSEHLEGVSVDPTH